MSISTVLVVTAFVAVALLFLIERTRSIRSPRHPDDAFWREVERLHRSSPAEADLLTEQYFIRIERKAAEARNALRGKATTEAHAALLLQRLLQEDLDAVRRAQAAFNRRAGMDGGAQRVWTRMLQKERDIRAELADLEEQRREFLEGP